MATIGNIFVVGKSSFTAWLNVEDALGRRHVHSASSGSNIVYKGHGVNSLLPILEDTDKSVISASKLFGFHRIETSKGSSALTDTHGVALSTTGALYTWGDPSLSGSTLEHAYSYDEPKKDTHLGLRYVPGMEGTVSFSTSDSHCVAVKSDGSAYAWGWSSKGQLGLHPTSKNGQTLLALGDLNKEFTEFSTSRLGSGMFQSTPRFVRALAKYFVQAVSCGSQHSLFVTRCGRLFGVGDNSCGQLGLGANNGTIVNPTEVQLTNYHPSEAFVQEFSVLRRQQLEAAAEMLGDTAFLAHSDAYTNMQDSIVLGQDADTFVVEVVTYYAHTLIRTRTGHVFSCGLNTYGQLGLGDTVSRYHPNMVYAFISQNTFAEKTSKSRNLTWNLEETDSSSSENVPNPETKIIPLLALQLAVGTYHSAVLSSTMLLKSLYDTHQLLMDELSLQPEEPSSNTLATLQKNDTLLFTFGNSLDGRLGHSYGEAPGSEIVVSDAVIRHSDTSSPRNPAHDPESNSRPFSAESLESDNTVVRALPRDPTDSIQPSSHENDDGEVKKPAAADPGPTSVFRSLEWPFPNGMGPLHNPLKDPGHTAYKVDQGAKPVLAYPPYEDPVHYLRNIERDVAVAKLITKTRNEGYVDQLELALQSEYHSETNEDSYSGSPISHSNYKHAPMVAHKLPQGSLEAALLSDTLNKGSVEYGNSEASNPGSVLEAVLANEGYLSPPVAKPSSHPTNTVGDRVSRTGQYHGVGSLPLKKSFFPEYSQKYNVYTSNNFEEFDSAVRQPLHLYSSAATALRVHDPMQATSQGQPRLAPNIYDPRNKPLSGSNDPKSYEEVESGTWSLSTTRSASHQKIREQWKNRNKNVQNVVAHTVLRMPVQPTDNIAITNPSVNTHRRHPSSYSEDPFHRSVVLEAASITTELTVQQSLSLVEEDMEAPSAANIIAHLETPFMRKGPTPLGLPWLREERKVNNGRIVAFPTPVTHPLLHNRRVTKISYGKNDLVIFSPARLRKVFPWSAPNCETTLLTLKGPGFASLLATPEQSLHDAISRLRLLQIMAKENNAANPEHHYDENELTVEAVSAVKAYCPPLLLGYDIPYTYPKHFPPESPSDPPLVPIPGVFVRFHCFWNIEAEDEDKSSQVHYVSELEQETNLRLPPLQKVFMQQAYYPRGYDLSRFAPSLRSANELGAHIPLPDLESPYFKTKREYVMDKNGKYFMRQRLQFAEDIGLEHATLLLQQQQSGNASRHPYSGGQGNYHVSPSDRSGNNVPSPFHCIPETLDLDSIHAYTPLVPSAASVKMDIVCLDALDLLHNGVDTVYTSIPPSVTVQPEVFEHYSISPPNIDEIQSTLTNLATSIESSAVEGIIPFELYVPPVLQHMMPKNVAIVSSMRNIEDVKPLDNEETLECLVDFSNDIRASEDSYEFEMAQKADLQQSFLDVESRSDLGMDTELDNQMSQFDHRSDDHSLPTPMNRAGLPSIPEETGSSTHDGWDGMHIKLGQNAPSSAMVPSSMPVPLPSVPEVRVTGEGIFGCLLAEPLSRPFIKKFIYAVKQKVRERELADARKMEEEVNAIHSNFNDTYSSYEKIIPDSPETTERGLDGFKVSVSEKHRIGLLSLIRTIGSPKFPTRVLLQFDVVIDRQVVHSSDPVRCYVELNYEEHEFDAKLVRKKIVANTLQQLFGVLPDRSMAGGDNPFSQNDDGDDDDDDAEPGIVGKYSAVLKTPLPLGLLASTIQFAFAKTNGTQFEPKMVDVRPDYDPTLKNTPVGLLGSGRILNTQDKHCSKLRSALYKLLEHGNSTLPTALQEEQDYKADLESTIRKLANRPPKRVPAHELDDEDGLSIMTYNPPPSIPMVPPILEVVSLFAAKSFLSHFTGHTSSEVDIVNYHSCRSRVDNVLYNDILLGAETGEVDYLVDYTDIVLDPPYKEVPPAFAIFNDNGMSDDDESDHGLGHMSPRQPSSATNSRPSSQAASANADNSRPSTALLKDHVVPEVYLIPRISFNGGASWHTMDKIDYEELKALREKKRQRDLERKKRLMGPSSACSSFSKKESSGSIQKQTSFSLGSSHSLTQVPEKQIIMDDEDNLSVELKALEDDEAELENNKQVLFSKSVLRKKGTCVKQPALSHLSSLAIPLQHVPYTSMAHEFLDGDSLHLQNSVDDLNASQVSVWKPSSKDIASHDNRMRVLRAFGVGLIPNAKCKVTLTRYIPLVELEKSRDEYRERLATEIARLSDEMQNLVLAAEAEAQEAANKRPKATPAKANAKAAKSPAPTKGGKAVKGGNVTEADGKNVSITPPAEDQLLADYKETIANLEKQLKVLDEPLPPLPSLVVYGRVSSNGQYIEIYLGSLESLLYTQFPWDKFHVAPAPRRTEDYIAEKLPLSPFASSVPRSTTPIEEFIGYFSVLVDVVMDGITLSSPETQIYLTIFQGKCVDNPSPMYLASSSSVSKMLPLNSAAQGNALPPSPSGVPVPTISVGFKLAPSTIPCQDFSFAALMRKTHRRLAGGLGSIHNSGVDMEHKKQLNTLVQDIQILYSNAEGSLSDCWVPPVVCTGHPKVGLSKVLSGFVTFYPSKDPSKFNSARSASSGSAIDSNTDMIGLSNYSDNNEVSFKESLLAALKNVLPHSSYEDRELASNNIDPNVDDVSSIEIVDNPAAPPYSVTLKVPLTIERVPEVSVPEVVEPSKAKNEKSKGLTSPAFTNDAQKSIPSTERQFVFHLKTLFSRLSVPVGTFVMFSVSFDGEVHSAFPIGEFLPSEVVPPLTPYHFFTSDLPLAQSPSAAQATSQSESPFSPPFAVVFDPAHLTLGSVQPYSSKGKLAPGAEVFAPVDGLFQVLGYTHPPMEEVEVDNPTQTLSSQPVTKGSKGASKDAARSSTPGKVAKPKATKDKSGEGHDDQLLPPPAWRIPSNSFLRARISPFQMKDIQNILKNNNGEMYRPVVQARLEPGTNRVIFSLPNEVPNTPSSLLVGIDVVAEFSLDQGSTWSKHSPPFKYSKK